MRATILCTILLIICISASSAAQDVGAPDSAYLLPSEYSIVDCSPTVRVTIPVYLKTDVPYYRAQFDFLWSGNVNLDTINIVGEWAKGDLALSVIHRDSMKAWVFTNILDPGVFLPTSDVIAEIVFSGDILEVVGLDFAVQYPDEGGFWLTDIFGRWFPTYQQPDTMIAFPDTLELTNGDADCSNSASISDAVYIINYIFANGCPPADHNAADPDQSCTISISDAVYLINHIFGGGPTPLPGCVVE